MFYSETYFWISIVILISALLVIYLLISASTKFFNEVYSEEYAKSLKKMRELEENEEFGANFFGLVFLRSEQGFRHYRGRYVDKMGIPIENRRIKKRTFSPLCPNRAVCLD